MATVDRATSLRILVTWADPHMLNLKPHRSGASLFFPGQLRVERRSRQPMRYEFAADCLRSAERTEWPLHEIPTPHLQALFSGELRLPRCPAQNQCRLRSP